MAKVIRLPYGAVSKLAEKANAARSTVHQALDCRTFSDKADEIRRLALEEFGGYYSQKKYRG